MNRQPLHHSLIPVGFVAVLAVAGVWSLRPPDPPAGPVPPAQFSTERALRHLEQIAREPHAVGTPAHDRVREYVLTQFTAAGVEVSQQDATVTRTRPGRIVAAARIHNLAARLPGTAGPPAVLLAAHYDSAPAAPGASDDGHGVAVLLESLRALQSGPRLKHDVIFLATDAEEAGLWGAKAFVEQHPWRKQVALALNLEARGTGGPTWMFRTNPGSGWLVRALAQAAPFPQASSITDEVFRYMPNDTDLSEFRRAGYPGLDFAYIDQPIYYHSTLDDLQNLDRRSLYQQGANALALVRYLGNLDPFPQETGDAIYHGTARTGVWTYPKRSALLLAFVPAALLMLASVAGVFLRRLRLIGVLGGACGLLLAMALSCTAAWFGESLLERGARDLFASGYQRSVYQLALLALVLAITSALYAWFLRKTSVSNLWLGAMEVWMILALISAAAFPGLSYVFVWPLLASSASVLIWLAWGDEDFRRPGPLAVIYLLSAPAILLIAQVLAALLVAFPTGGTAIAAAFVVLLVGLLIPHLALAQASGRWWLPAASALACLLLLGTATLHRGFDARHPQPDTLGYGLDADSSQAYWLSFDAAPDAYTAQFLGQHPPRAPLPQLFPATSPAILQAPAPAQPLAPTDVELAASRTEGGLRAVQLRLRPRRAMTWLYLYLDPNVEVVDGAVDGIPFPPAAAANRASQGRPLLVYCGLPAEGATLELRLKGAAQPLRIIAVDRSYGASAVPRPAGFSQTPFNPDMTLVKKSWQWD
jgi:hypothetical protein